MKVPVCWLQMVLSLAIFVPLATAQSPFDGTWQLDTSDVSDSTAHDVYLLRDGVFRCETCEPPFEVKADGIEHRVTGNPCYDAVSIRVVDDRSTEEVDKRNGKPAGSLKITVSEDGKTAIEEWTESCNAKGDDVTGKDLMSRVENGPRGSHAISGSWRIAKRLERSQNALVIKLKLERDTFSFTDPADQSFVAKLDGTETRINGDLSGTMVSVKRIGENTVEETNSRNGKVVEIDRFTLSGDGKTLTIEMVDKVNETKKQFVAHKQ